MPSLVGGMSHRNAGSSGRNGRVRNKRTDKSSSSTKGNGRAARSFAAVAGLVLCSVGLLGLSGNSDAGKLSSYFWGYASTQKRGAGLVARILLAAEKYEFKDESSGENATSVMSSSETEHSSVSERQMLKIVSAYENMFVWMFKLQNISYRCYVHGMSSCTHVCLPRGMLLTHFSMWKSNKYISGRLCWRRRKRWIRFRRCRFVSSCGTFAIRSSRQCSSGVSRRGASVCWSYSQPVRRFAQW